MIASIKETDLLYEEWKEGFAKGFSEAFAEGRAEGIAESKTEIAKRMLISGKDEDYVHQMTDLPIDEIRRLNS